MTSDADHIVTRSQVSELLSRYLAAVDDKRVDAGVVSATFTADARLIRPNDDVLVGREAIERQQAKSFRRFRATQHITNDHVVELGKGDARLRANMTAMHLWSPEESDPCSLQAHFLAGGVFEGWAVQSEQGWRFRELRTRIVWRTGAGFASVLNMGRTG